MTLRGVRKAQAKLASFYLVAGGDEGVRYARQIYDDMKDERPERLSSICDELLGEVGRRAHIFAWLRAPGAGADEWLPVDAYYPRARLVVMCRSGSRPDDAVYRELVPAHGLGLMTLESACIPVPSEVIQLFAGYLVSAHRMSLFAGPTH